jgi:hypothetical protein
MRLMRVLIGGFISMSLICGIRRADADDNGTFVLVDRHGNTIGSSVFTSLNYCGAGIYQGTLKGTKKVGLFNKDGEKVEMPLPTGYKLEQLILKRDTKGKATTMPDDALMVVSHIGLQGIVDKRGKFLIAPEYDSIRYLGDKIYILTNTVPNTGQRQSVFFDVETGRRSKEPFTTEWFNFGSVGEGRIAFEAPRMRDPHGGWSDPKHGYCDIDHNIIIPAIYEWVGSFQDGLAIVRVSRPSINSEKMTAQNAASPSRNVYIDKNGKMIEPELEPVSLFDKNGLAIAARATNPGVVGLINRKFEFVTEPAYETINQVATEAFAGRPSNHEAMVLISTAGKKMFDFPDTVTNVEWYYGPGSDPGFMVTEEKDGNSKIPEGYKNHNSLMNMSGKIVIPPNYYLEPPRDGLVVATAGFERNRTCGVMNCNGEFLIPLQDAFFSLTEPDRLIKSTSENK